ncbi:MAG: hypothetical protein JSW39_22580 [Desulfobacterales bacterium]|nr:MAG: hypothetical protein JSW39_22580 [Desulfobacterales bacterium]
MDIYRTPMQKILKQMEDDTIITNPKDPGKTFLRKIAYRRAYWADRLKKIFRRRPAAGGRQE